MAHTQAIRSERRASVDDVKSAKILISIYNPHKKMKVQSFASPERLSRLMAFFVNGTHLLCWCRRRASAYNMKIDKLILWARWNFNFFFLLLLSPSRSFPTFFPSFFFLISRLHHRDLSLPLLRLVRLAPLIEHFSFWQWKSLLKSTRDEKSQSLHFFSLTRALPDDACLSRAELASK